MSPYVQKHYMEKMEEQHQEHHAAIDTFTDLANRMGKEVLVRTEDEAQLSDMRDVDCVVSLGGDHTFLKASSLIWDRMVPILGINTNRRIYAGALNHHYIDPSDRER